MPYYEYQCDDCGAFTQQRPMSEAGRATLCPGCQQSARALISAPFLASMHPHTRIAHERNERSAHEPRLEQRGSGAATSSSKQHGHHHHHGHQHPHHHGATPKRPWMIGH